PRVLVGEVVGFRKILVEMIKLPAIDLEGRAGRMKGDGLPALVPQAAMTEHLEVLRTLARRSGGVAQAGGETLALERHLRHAVDRLRRRQADGVDQCRCQIAGVAELVA